MQMKSEFKNKCAYCGAPCRIKYCPKCSLIARAKDADRYNASKNPKRLKANDHSDKFWSVMARMIKPDTNIEEDRIVLGEASRYTMHK
jgi:hypothetical protein